MSKFQIDAMLDAALGYIDTNMTTLHVNTEQPATRAAAISDSLATVTIDSSDGTIADGDTSGRKLTIAQQASLTIDASGTATHVSVIDGSNLLYVTTCTSQALTMGGEVTIPAWDIEIADAS